MKMKDGGILGDLKDDRRMTMNRPYIFCHMTSLDGKIMGNYMNTPEGGAALNWSFIQAGMCDEVSVVIAAAADGSSTTQTLFMARDGLSDETPVRFELQSAEGKDGGSVWLRYKVCQGKGA